MNTDCLRYNYLIKQLDEKTLKIDVRNLTYEFGMIRILCIKEIVNINLLAEQVVKPLLEYCHALKQGAEAKTVAESVIYAYDTMLERDNSEMLPKILDGMIIILLSDDEPYITVNLKKVEHRDVATPELTYTIRGPRDSFIENLDVNISLIRYRIKDPNLKIETLHLGTRTKTKIAVLYLKDVANDETVQEVMSRLKSIHTDAIWGSGEIQAFMLNRSYNLFPQMGTVERSDMACELIVDGRVLILADGGQIGIFAPFTFFDMLNACDDRYDNKYIGLFSRIIRLIALVTTLTLSSVYIALVSFHTSILPAQFAISLAEMRKKVLFPSFVEVLLIEFLIELLRESLLRVPSKIGIAVGVVGAIVIGNAAISAGVFSPLVLIIAALVLLSSFAIPDYFGAHPIRILKFLLILFTGLLGFYGFILGITLILLNLVSIDSFGVPYMAPFAPYNNYDFVRTFIYNRSDSPHRRKMLRTKNQIRGRKMDR